jgi:hypothetical protein
VRVVHDLPAHVDGRPEFVQRHLDRLHSPVDPGAVASRLGEQDPTAAAESSQPPPPAAAKPLAPEAALPLPRYDDLPLASIRARLRGLSVSQLRILAEYEARNAERPEVLGMFERRIEKLEAQS